MIVTEKEASTKWCHTPAQDHCCGSRCMAWQWVYDLKRKMTTPDKHIETDKGYCGLVNVERRFLK